MGDRRDAGIKLAKTTGYVLFMLAAYVFFGAILYFTWPIVAPLLPIVLIPPIVKLIALYLIFVVPAFCVLAWLYFAFCFVFAPKLGAKSSTPWE